MEVECFSEPPLISRIKIEFLGSLVKFPTQRPMRSIGSCTAFDAVPYWTRKIIMVPPLSSDFCSLSESRAPLCCYGAPPIHLSPVLYFLPCSPGADFHRRIIYDTRCSSFMFSFSFMAKTINLAEVVEFSDSDDLKTTLESQLQQPFNITTPLPLWRLVVLKGNIICLAWHHCIGDGISGLAFHRSLITSLTDTNNGTFLRQYF